jgi:parvulin-like peptidyl-prolyl isomerase
MANPKKKKEMKTKKHLAREQREAKQTRIILIITIVIGALVLGLVAYGLVENLIIRPNKTVARIGEEVIKVDDFETRVEYTRVQMLNQSYQYYMMYQQLGAYGQSLLEAAQNYATQLTQPEAIGSDVLDQMIDGIIIKDEAAARGITVSKEEVDEAIQEAFGFYPEGTYTPSITATIESTPTYSETQLALVTLTSTPTETAAPTDTPEVTSTASENPEVTDSETGLVDPVTEETSTEPTEFPESTPSPDVSPTITTTPTVFTTELFAENIKDFNKSYAAYDFDIENLREIFEIQLLKDKLIEIITDDMIPVEEEVWARHILVETEEEAHEVLAKLDTGMEFHDLAAEYSTDESNKNNGGDLGWFDDETMVAEFTEIAFDLEIGEISEPVETTFGFHIIQVLGKRESQVPADEFKQDKEKAFDNWLEQQRNARNDIVIYDEWQEYVSDKPEVPQQFLIQLYQSNTGQ